MAKTEEKKDSNDTFGLLLVGAAAAVGALIAGLASAVVATVLYWAGIRKLQRREAIVLLVASLIGVGLTASTSLGASIGWSLSLAGVGDHSRTDIPLFWLLCTGLLLSSLFVIIRGTSVVSAAATKVGLKRKPKAFEESESIIPSEEVRQSAKVAAPPGGALTIDASLHTMEANELGGRDFPIGISADRTPVMINETELKMHAVILGSTGSGKTETIKAVAGALLDLGWDGIILDHKEDVSVNGLRDWCDAYAANHALPYQELYLSDENGKYWFNPLGGMSADEARDTILAMETFPDAFWEAINKNTLGQVCTLMYDCHAIDPSKFGEPNPRSIGALLGQASGRNGSGGKGLPAATKAMRATALGALPNRSELDYRVMSNPSDDESSASVGFASRLEAPYQTAAGRLVLQPDSTGGRRMLDVTSSGLTYLGLDSQGKPDLTRLVSASVMRRLCVMSANRVRAGVKPKQMFIIIDEANVVNRSSLMELLSRARSAGITVIVCTQGPEDFNMDISGKPANGPGWKELAQNINVAIIMSQGELSQAEICADYIGKEVKTLAPNQLTGEGEVLEQGSLRSVRDHVVSPDDLRTLSIGEAILRVGKPRTRVSWMTVKIRPPEATARW